MFNKNHGGGLPDTDIDNVLVELQGKEKLRRSKALIDFPPVGDAPERQPGDNIIIAGWLAGLSTNAIAVHAGRTKNAVVGRSHRLMALGLIEPRETPIYRDDPNHPPRQPKPKRVKGDATLPPLLSAVAETELDAMGEPAMPPYTPPAFQRPTEIRQPVDHAKAVRAAVAAKSSGIPSPFSDRIYREPKPAETLMPYRRTQACCWPIGEPGARDFRYCDAPHKNRTYCDEHEALAFVKVRPASERNDLRLNVGGATLVGFRFQQ